MTTAEQTIMDSGDSLVKIAGELYGDTSKFRELAELNNLDIITFNGSNLNLDTLEDTGVKLITPTLASIEKLAAEAQVAVIESVKRIEDEAVATFQKVTSAIKGIDTTALDLSQIKGANGELPAQLISWLLS
jgi:hypothetical protein